MFSFVIKLNNKIYNWLGFRIVLFHCMACVQFYCIDFVISICVADVLFNCIV